MMSLTHLSRVTHNIQTHALANEYLNNAVECWKKNSPANSTQLSFPAKFAPRDGVFTRTVNVGDTGVSIQMLRISNPDEDGRETNWRKDGGDKISAVEGSLIYNFTDPIQPSDEGIYEIHYDVERDRGALYRIIVRGNSLPHFVSQYRVVGIINYFISID